MRWDDRTIHSETPLSEPHVSAAEAFLALSGELKTRCSVATDRLVSARRTYGSSKVIDLAIALEALLAERDANTEVGFRLRLRAALLLETEIDKRLTVSKAVQNFYSVRSKLVHGAAVALTQTQSTNVGEVMEITGRLLTTLIQLGHVPRWVELDVGGAA